LLFIYCSPTLGVTNLIERSGARYKSGGRQSSSHFALTKRAARVAPSVQIAWLHLLAHWLKLRRPHCVVSAASSLDEATQSGQMALRLLTVAASTQVSTEDWAKIAFLHRGKKRA
jgi:hypothetical protein